jgi:hypothetical protein
MAKKKVILVGSKIKGRVKRRRRRIGEFTREMRSYIKNKRKAMSSWERICADVASINN